MTIRDRVKALPLVGPTATSVRRLIAKQRFPGSSEYWERRYSDGGNSGAGSYGQTARFKADTLNALVANHGIQSVIEFGCGDGAQLELAEYPAYTGLDVSRTAVQRCMKRFSGDVTKSFIWYDPAAFRNHGALVAEVAISLDVVLHLVEDDVLHAYLHEMSNAATRSLIFFTEDQKPQPAGSPHVRYRNVADWIARLDGWTLVETVNNPAKGLESQADFFVFGRSGQ